MEIAGYCIPVHVVGSSVDAELDDKCHGKCQLLQPGSRRLTEVCPRWCQWNGPDCEGRCSLAWDHSDGAHICRPCFEDNTVEIRAALAVSLGDVVEEEIVEQYRRLGGPACDPELFRQACDDEFDADCCRTIQADDEYLAMLEELKELTAVALEANRNLAQARQAVATYRNDSGFGKIVVKLQNTRNWLLSGGGGKFPSPGGKGPSDVCWVCGGPHFAFQCPDKDAGKSKGFG